jgi:PAS domain S-box-containing protein
MRTFGYRLLKVPASSLILSIVMTVLLSGMLMPASAASSPLTPEEQAWLDRYDGRIVMGHETGWLPFAGSDEYGEHYGLSVDVYRLLEKKLGFRFRMSEPDNWTNTLEKFRSRDIDVICEMQINDERAEYALFTKPYLDISNVILVRKQVKGNQRLRDMGGQRVAVGDGYAIHDFLKTNHADLDLVPLENDMHVLLELSAGRVEAAVVNLAAASYIIEREGISNLRVAGQAGYRNALCIASRNDWPILNSILDKGLAMITRAERDAVYRKWIHLDVEPFYRQPKFRAIILGLLVVIGGGLLLLMFWNRSLHIRVARRTATLDKANRDLSLEIEARVEAEAALLKNEAQLRSLVETIPDMIWMKDPNGVYLSCNQRFEDFFGASSGEICGKTDYDFVNEELADFFRLKDKDAIAAGESCTNEEEVVFASDGHREILETIKTPIFDESGRVIGVLGIARDITEHKKTAERIREREEYFRAIIENSFDVISILKADGTIAYESPSHLRVLGYESGELLGQNVFERVHPDDHKRISTQFGDLLQRPGEMEQVHFRFLHADGSWRHLEGAGLNLLESPAVNGIVVNYRDVTEQVEAAASLQESERRFRMIFDQTFQFAGILDLDGVVTAVNRTALEFIGKSSDEILGLNFVDTPWWSHSESMRNWIRDAISRAVTGEVVQGEITHKAVDGSLHYFDFTMKPVAGDDGRPIHLIAESRDITERKKAEADLVQSREFLDSIINNIADPVFVKDEGHHWTAFNDAFCDLLGVTRSELMGKTDTDLFPADQVGGFWMHDDEVWASGRPSITEETITIGDRTRVVSTSKASFTNPITGQKNIVGTIRDITDNKKAEQELQQMQKLKSVGMLAGGIAHDFNNILMGLYGNISMAREDLKQEHPGYKALEEAEQSMERAVHLSSQLLTFAKGGAPVKENVSLGELVEEVARFDLSGSNVELICEKSPDLWRADVDAGQMQQVFSNLVINAKQSMLDGGHLFIKLENEEISRDRALILDPGRYIRISFRDEGAGIDQVHIDRIFDPYFSTKETGSGLGLATAYSIVDKHGGHIFVNSKVKEGTTFTLYLPASTQKAPVRAKAPQTDPSPKRAVSRILVMDDETPIRTLVSRMLGKDGFTVETVENGDQAIRMYKDGLIAGRRYDAIIMDLTIPGGMGGKEAGLAILDLDPEARVVVSSGYADDPVMANFGQYGFSGVAVKPYTKAKLLEIMYEVLDN